MSADPSADRPPWVLVSSGFHCNGGQPRANLALAEFLVRRGHAVHLVGHDFDDSMRDRPGVTLHGVKRWSRHEMSGWVPIYRAGRRVAARVTQSNPTARVLVSGACSSWTDLNWVHCVHHAWQPADDGAPLWYRLKNRLTRRVSRWLERRSIRPARLVVTNSERTRQEVMQHLGMPADRVEAVYLGTATGVGRVDTAERTAERRRLGLDDATPVVLFVGALGYDQNKGMDVLLDAWAGLCKEPTWDALLLAAGEGTGRQRWERQAEQAGIADRVRFLGWVGDVNRLLAVADLLVSPVRYEAYGLNVHEAISRGVPTLVSARAGVTERFPDEFAPMILPDPEDASDLARRLRAWRTDLPGWRERFAPLGETFRRYTWDDMAARIVALAETHAG